MIFSIPIYLPSGKQEYIKFVLNQSKLEKDEIIENLGKRIEELENTVLIFKENFKQKENQINDILKRLQILENEKKEREEKKEKNYY